MHRIRYLLIPAWFITISLLYYRLFPFPEIIKSLPRLSPLVLSPQSLGHLLHLLCLSLLVLSANGWGRTFWRNRDLSPVGQFSMATGAGLGFLSLAVLLTDLLGFINPFFYFVLLLAGLGLFLTVIAKVRPRPDLHVWLLLLFASLPLAGSLIGALAPPTQFDSLVYHLALPSKYLHAGRMFAVPSSLFFSFPQNLEMLFQMAMQLDGDILANLVSWLFLPLTALAIFSLARRFWNARTGLIAAITWLFTPEMLFLSTGTYVDLGLAFFTFLSLYSFLLWNESHRRSWLYWSGVFCGLALGTKYTAGISFIILATMVALESKSLKRTGTFAAFALLLFTPWLLKNALFLKNPFAPWATRLFAGSSITPDLAQGYFSHIQGHGAPVESILDFLLLPWQITAYGFRFGGAFDIIGPLFLLFIPVLFLRLKIDKIIKVLLVYISAFLVIWLLTGKVLRFLVPVMPVLCILVARGFDAFSSTKTARGIAYAVLALGLFHNILLFHWTILPIDPYSVVLSGESRDRYLTRKVNYFKALNDAVNTLPVTARILFWGETRSYYCARESIVPTVFDRHPLIDWANASATPGDLLGTLRKEKITHILVNNYEVQRLGVANGFSFQGKETWTHFREYYTRRIYRDTYCDLYEIRSSITTGT